MILPIELQIPIAAFIGVFLMVLAAERLHGRRCRVVARLATGPTGRPRRWVRLVPTTRALTLGSMAWALVTLYYADGSAFGRHSDPEDRREDRRHVVFVADLSPSMTIEDAGPDGDRTRAQRSHEVVDAILQRLDRDLIYTVIGFYTEAMPVVVDTEDAELVRNVFDGLPVWYVMQPGKTDLGKGVTKTLEHLRDYPSDATTVFICTDGDTVRPGAIPKPPPAVGDIYVLGVGNPKQGTFIDDHMSRQDPSVLRALAGRLGGKYVDVNEKHMPTLTLGTLAAGVGVTDGGYDLVDWAIFVLLAAASIHALIPVLLQYFGSDWKTVRATRLETNRAESSTEVVA